MARRRSRRRQSRRRRSRRRSRRRASVRRSSRRISDQEYSDLFYLKNEGETLTDSQKQSMLRKEIEKGMEKYPEFDDYESNYHKVLMEAKDRSAIEDSYLLRYQFNRYRIMPDREFEHPLSVKLYKNLQLARDGLISPPLTNDEAVWMIRFKNYIINDDDETSEFFDSSTLYKQLQREDLLPPLTNDEKNWMISFEGFVGMRTGL